MGRGLSAFHANDFRLSLFPGRPHSLGRLVQAVCGSQPKADKAWCQTLWAVVSADGFELSFVGALRAAAQSLPRPPGTLPGQGLCVSGLGALFVTSRCLADANPSTGVPSSRGRVSAEPVRPVGPNGLLVCVVPGLHSLRRGVARQGGAQAGCGQGLARSGLTDL